ncbi:spondin domain-containing protein [Maribacter sp. 2308TA10-17]|uniref:spondin domain-containing protein n=1 Tax=Maribacter sp. 2308TA10-17 TaxID=3386276 RepID=UPI0039BD46D2
MKKVNIFKSTLAAMLVFGLTSCENDDSPDVIAEAQQEEQAEEQPMTNNVISVVINEVRYRGEDTIEILNNGTGSIDLADYWLCLGPGQYVQIGSLTPISGSIDLPSAEYLVLSYDIPDDQGGLGLYSTNQFTDSSALVDFVQWGAAGSAREDVAVAAGQWVAGDFVPAVGSANSSIAYDGQGDVATDWNETTTLTFGAVNQITALVASSFNVTITNIINYLAVQVFNTPDGADTPGPVPNKDGSYWFDFQATPGSKLSFATMQVVSNDWFYAPTGAGITLFENGVPVTGDVTNQIYLWDSGTEEEDPATITSVPGGAEAGDPDDDNTVRIVTTDVTSMVKVTLDYEESTRTFRLLIKNLTGAMDVNEPVILAPGIAVVHALDNPLFTEGEPERELGLAKIAVQGNPSDLYGWFTETGSTGAPLRLSSSYSVFAPAVVYAFDSENDPVFTQGEAAVAGSGIEESAEDGNNQIIFDYINTTLGIPVAKSNEAMPIAPGQSFTFTLEDVPVGYKFGFNTMLVNTNDWFLAYNNTGYPLFDENESPQSGTGATEKSYLYDAGTEVDQVVGFGADQPMRQAGPNSGAADENTSIRRVSEIDDVQFGKGLISSAAGVVGYADPRGGYNLIKVTITPN